jgi:hypothetical protein
MQRGIDDVSTGGADMYVDASGAFRSVAVGAADFFVSVTNDSTPREIIKKKKKKNDMTNTIKTNRKKIEAKKRRARAVARRFAGTKVNLTSATLRFFFPRDTRTFSFYSWDARQYLSSLFLLKERETTCW